FSLCPVGGSVVTSRCSQTFETKVALLSLFGFPLWLLLLCTLPTCSDVQPGDCWPFRGSSGILVLRLSSRVLPSAFSLEHLPKNLSPTGSIHSAPKDFTVYDEDDDEEEEGKLLGTFQYDKDGEALQTYTPT
ncbi:hypothetical protein NL108_016018, partial [Boleophthalmus pectinirostris]